MGDTQNLDNQQQTDPNLSAPEMTRALQMVMIPFLYEKAYNNASGSEEDKRAEAKEALHEGLRSTESLNNVEAAIVNVDNTTAIILYETEEHRATVIFDPTQTAGDLYDGIVDHGLIEHSLGGKVHGGFYNDLIEQQNSDSFPGDNMVEVIEGVLHDCASKNQVRDLSVDFSGFCNGGARSALTTGEMINNGMFDQNPNIKLDNVYTFAPVGYADQTFIDKLENDVDNLDANLWQIQLHGDNASNSLTPSGSWIADKGYGQAGTHIYLVPGENGSNTQVLVNPDQAEIDDLPKSSKAGLAMHRPEPYEEAIAAIDDAQEPYEVPPRDVEANMLLGL